MFTVIYFSFFSFFLFLFLFACFVGNEERLTLIDTVLYSFTATNKGKHPVSSHVQERANWRICCFRQHPIESLVNPDWLSSCPWLARCQLWLGFPIQNTFIAMSCVLPKSCCYIPAKFLRSPVLPTVKYVSSRKKNTLQNVTPPLWLSCPIFYGQPVYWVAVMWAHAPRMNLQNTAPSPQSALFTLCRSVYKQPDSLTARGGSHYPI